MRGAVVGNTVLPMNILRGGAAALARLSVRNKIVLAVAMVLLLTFAWHVLNTTFFLSWPWNHTDWKGDPVQSHYRDWRP